MIHFDVPGKPQPAGSKRAFVIPGTNRAQVVDANKNAKPWQAEVKARALQEMVSEGLELLDGPLFLSVVFSVPRPKGHYGAKGVKESAPKYPTTRPDATKLVRGLEDALTGIVWRDDAQVVSQDIKKVYGDVAMTSVLIGRYQ